MDRKLFQKVRNARPYTSLVGNLGADEDTGKTTSRDTFQNCQFDDIGIAELLETDTRPTFVVDLKSPGPISDIRMNVVFSNKSMRFFDELRTIINTDTYYPPTPMPPSSPSGSSSSSSTLQDVESEVDFKEWATKENPQDGIADTFLNSYTFRGLLWTSTTLRNRWRIISASQVPNQRKRSQSSRSNSVPLTPSPLTDSERSLTSLDELDLPAQLAEARRRFKVLTEMSPVGM
jgi:hypothetical protein